MISSPGRRERNTASLKESLHRCPQAAHRRTADVEKTEELAMMHLWVMAVMIIQFTVVELFGSYRLHLPSAVLDPLQVDVAEAGSRHPLKAVHVVFIDLHAEDLRVALDVVPLGVGLQRFLDGGVRQPGG